MSDKNKSIYVGSTVKVNKPRRPSVAPQMVNKDRASASRFRSSKNTTISGDLDMTSPFGNLNEENHRMAYGKFLRALLQDCLFDDTIEREKTEIDIAMGQLASRFEQSVELLGKTSARLKDIRFFNEQQRLLKIKQEDCDIFYEAAEKEKHLDRIQNLCTVEESCLNQLDTKNVDFGYSKEDGHKELLDAINDCLQGFEEIKKTSKLDSTKLEEYEKCQISNEEFQKQKIELENLKKEFELKFPNFSEKLLIDMSSKMSELAVENYDDGDEDTDDGSLRT